MGLLDGLLSGIKNVFEAGTLKSTRSGINFIGATVTDDEANDRLDIEITGTGTPTTRVITAGAGLTGGGDLSTDRTINVGAANSTIVVEADGVRLSPALATTDQSITDSATLTLIATGQLDLASTGGTARLRSETGQVFIGGNDIDMYSATTWHAEADGAMTWFGASTMAFESVGSLGITSASTIAISSPGAGVATSQHLGDPLLWDLELWSEDVVAVSGTNLVNINSAKVWAAATTHVTTFVPNEDEVKRVEDDSAGSYRTRWYDGLGALGLTQTVSSTAAVDEYAGTYSLRAVGAIAFDPNSATGMSMTHVPGAGPAVYLTAGTNRLHLYGGNGGGQDSACELRLVASAAGSAFDFLFTNSLGYKIAVDPMGAVTCTAGPSATSYGLVCSAGAVFTQCSASATNSMNGGNLEFRSGTRLANFQNYSASETRFSVRYPAETAIASTASTYTTLLTVPMSGAAGGAPDTLTGMVHVWEAGGSTQVFEFRVTFRPDGATGTMVGTPTITAEGDTLGTLDIDSTGGCRLRFLSDASSTNTKTARVTGLEFQ